MEPQPQPLVPDQAAITADLELTTRRWGELEIPCMLELRSFADGTPPAWVQFTPSRLGEAIEWVVQQNAEGRNIYVVRNPIALAHKGSATDASIVAAFFCWADCDDTTAADNVRRFDGPKWNATITTGKVPETRVHVYWELVEPARNLDAWRRMQVAIATHFRSDPVVVNPSRIMRVGGTVSYPPPRKQARGYTVEVCKFNATYPAGDEREPVEFERLLRVFGSGPVETKPADDSFRIDTGDHHHKTSDEYADILRRARTDGEKHSGVRDLVASLAGQGVSRTMAEAIVRDACPVWDRNVEQLLDSAYQKFYRHFDGSKQAEPSKIQASQLSAVDLAGIAPRPWLYGRKLVRGFVSVLASPGGTGKSAWVTAAACDMAAGISTLHDRPHAPLRVWLYNLEDPRDETLRKIAAVLLLKHYREPVLQSLFVDSGRDQRLILAEEPQPRLLVARPDVQAVIDEIRRNRIDVLSVDPFIRSHLLGENDNKAIDFVMDLYAQIASEANCAVLLVHHTRKGFVNGDSDSIRGGSSMTSAARVALTMQTMTPDEAQVMSISDAERRTLIRIDSAKSNLAPPLADAEWIKLESQSLDNGTPEYPDGDAVQVVISWYPPDAWDGIGEVKANEILDRIAYGFTTDSGATEKYSARPQDDRWAGHAIMASFPDGEKSADQCKRVIKTWLENGVLVDVEYLSPTQRKQRHGLDVGQRPGADR